MANLADAPHPLILEANDLGLTLKIRVLLGETNVTEYNFVPSLGDAVYTAHSSSEARAFMQGVRYGKGQTL